MIKIKGLKQQIKAGSFKNDRNTFWLIEVLHAIKVSVLRFIGS